MTKPPMTIYGALQAFLGPLEADYCRIIEEGSPDMPVTISLGNYSHNTTLGVIQDLDRAYAAAFDAKEKARERKLKGTLL